MSAGHESCVSTVLDAAAAVGQDGRVVNHEDPNGEAPLHVASRCGNHGVIKVRVSGLRGREIPPVCCVSE